MHASFLIAMNMNAFYKYHYTMIDTSYKIFIIIKPNIILNNKIVRNGKQFKRYQQMSIS